MNKQAVLDAMIKKSPYTIRQLPCQPNPYFDFVVEAKQRSPHALPYSNENIYGTQTNTYFVVIFKSNKFIFSKDKADALKSACRVSGNLVWFISENGKYRIWRPFKHNLPQYGSDYVVELFADGFPQKPRSHTWNPL